LALEAMLHPTIFPILTNWVAGQTPSVVELEQLVDDTLASPQQAKAFGITPLNVVEVIEERSHIFRAVSPNVLSLISFTNPQATLLTLWYFWLPLAMQLASLRQQLARPLIQGILGGQGTGKTTLAAVLRVILDHFGYRTLSLSLDDLYKTYAERQQLQQQDPRIIWRGPPGTHDVELGKQLLDQLRQPNLNRPVLVPRFDKSAYRGIGDRTFPEPVEGVDIVLFEGWFVGVRPLNPAVFDATTPAPIQTLGDREALLQSADHLFARDINNQLQDYVPLWSRLDRLMILYPVDYRLSKQWRRQAEQQMIATGKTGMTDAQVDEFVEYFWRALHPELFITPLTKNPSLVDLVVEINADHSVGAIYQPGDV
jgi:D-glycerate 3-kinase